MATIIVMVPRGSGIRRGSGRWVKQNLSCTSGQTVPRVQGFRISTAEKRLLAQREGEVGQGLYFVHNHIKGRSPRVARAPPRLWPVQRMRVGLRPPERRFRTSPICCSGRPSSTMAANCCMKPAPAAQCGSQLAFKKSHCTIRWAAQQAGCMSQGWNCQALQAACRVHMWMG